MRALIACLPLAFVVAASACGSSEHPPPFQAAGGSGGNPRDGGVDITASGGDPNVCGEEIFPAVSDVPTLYFVLDRSGSMNEPFAGLDESKYDTARDVLGEVLLSIGHRVRYGAAVFPANGDEGCNPGVQIFPTTKGDAATFAQNGTMGPVLSDLLSRLGFAQQRGGTPTAATLVALRPLLADLGPRTSVILATDGAPNCNLDTSCDASGCMPNVEQQTVNGVACDESFNCCEPDNTGPGVERWCVDGDGLEQAVADLAELDISTYVIGMPGASYYSDLLDRMATVGGTAQSGEHAYFTADDPPSLAQALHAIGTGIAISCTIELEREPEDQNQVNLYFDDARILPAEGEDGWRWVGPTTLEVLGAACNELKSGEVFELIIRYGCQTVLR